jgi:hypothetical protein
MESFAMHWQLHDICILNIVPIIPIYPSLSRIKRSTRSHEFLTPGVTATQSNPPYLHSEGSTMSNRYYLPNTLKNWKWPRRLNPHYLEVKEDSEAWARRLEGLGHNAQHTYDKNNIRTS